mmetsp:Transcript_12977/g.20107  ORF Transcript_12977/g.20107 Transcript_12977/m.20107 type:complete len:126 (+) Transcript_12977:202-579(+)
MAMKKGGAFQESSGFTMNIQKIKEASESPSPKKQMPKQLFKLNDELIPSVPEIKFNLMGSPTKEESPVMQKEFSPVREIKMSLYSADKRETQKSEKKPSTKQIAFSLFSADKKDRLISEYRLDAA